MKLWKKVSLLCSLVLVLVVGACTVLLITQARDEILNLTYQNAEQKQQALVRSFNNMLQYYHEEQDSEAATRSLMKYCFTQYADSEAVLMLSGETLYSSLSLDPSEYLTPEGSDTPQRYTGAVNGRQLLIVGGDARLPYSFTHNLEGLGCIVYIVQDITPVYDQIRTLTLQFIVIGAVCIGLGLLLIALLVRRSLRPLQKLQSAAAHIAEGNYAERAAVTSSDEVGALAQDFNAMAASVEQHIEELTETAERQRLFIGGVTHEFKTPLTALLLNADSLQNTYLDEEERSAALARIEHQTRWLERLVQKLLKLITLDQTPELQPVSVPELLDRVRESTADTLAARGVSLETDCRVEPLKLDADLMQDVLVNLVDNAGKASREGQTVTLSADETGFAVRDQGCGIPREEIDRITEPFYMVDRSRSKKLGGVGLGLALVKEIVQAHGGSLAIESTVGEGTTVRVVLASPSGGSGAQRR